MIIKTIIVDPCPRQYVTLCCYIKCSGCLRSIFSLFPILFLLLFVKLYCSLHVEAHFVMWCTYEKLVFLTFDITFPQLRTPLLCQPVVTVCVCEKDTCTCIQVKFIHWKYINLLSGGTYVYIFYKIHCGKLADFMLLVYMCGY